MGLRVALINPSFMYQNAYLQVTEPLGLLYLAAYLRRYTFHQVFVIDCLDSGLIKRIAPGSFQYGLSQEDMLSRILQINPDVVGITCTFSRKKADFYAAARAVKAKFPTAKLVAGGTYPSLFPEEVMASGIFSYAIVGEGEETLSSLLSAIETGTDPGEIQGLAYSRDGNIKVTPKTSYIKDLDSIPFPARDMIRYDRYLNGKSVLHGIGLKRCASILTSRSCPNQCNFCSMYKIHGAKWRPRSAANVMEEVKDLKSRYDIQQMYIMDDNFTFNKSRVLEFCELLSDAKLGIHWNTPNGISIKTLDKSVLAAMKRAGCTSVCIAIETGDEELRNKVIGKRLLNDKIYEVTQAAHELGLFVVAFYIIGMPGETEEKFQSTLDQVRSLPINGAAVAFANPLPGTRLFDDCFKQGHTILRTDDDEKNIFYKPYILTQDFTEEQLLKREKDFYRTFFRAKLFTLIKDTILMRNGLLYPPFLLRILRDRLFRS